MKYEKRIKTTEKNTRTTSEKTHEEIRNLTIPWKSILVGISILIGTIGTYLIM